MNNLITIENVKGYLDPVTGTAYLNAEDVARGFGFTTVAKSGNEVARYGQELIPTFMNLGFRPNVGERVWIYTRKEWC